MERKGEGKEMIGGRGDRNEEVKKKRKHQSKARSEKWAKERAANELCQTSMEAEQGKS